VFLIPRVWDAATEVEVVVEVVETFVVEELVTNEDEELLDVDVD
jgi:hypothetical protein